MNELQGNGIWVIPNGFKYEPMPFDIVNQVEYLCDHLPPDTHVLLGPLVDELMRRGLMTEMPKSIEAAQ